MTTKAIDASHPGLKPALDAGLQPRAAEQLLAFYDEPHRYYHNRVHIREMLDAALKHELKLSAAQTFAVLAHDAVYVPGAQRGDNETLSAQLMRVYAPKVDIAVLDAAFAIIIDTTDHMPRHTESTAVLDLDLMRLGAAPDDFERYSWEVFGEQRPLIAVDDYLAAWHFFDDKRAQFFQTLMTRPAIFHLAPMRAEYERACHINLGQTIAGAMRDRPPPKGYFRESAA
jgi:predicted metal-dependent HD superfamily phosphohydrolase